LEEEDSSDGGPAVEVQDETPTLIASSPPPFIPIPPLRLQTISEKKMSVLQHLKPEKFSEEKIQ